MNTLDFRVVGIFQSFSKEFDARAVRIPLAATQELMQTKGANQLVVALQNGSTTGLQDAAQFVGYQGEAAAPSSVLLWVELQGGASPTKLSIRSASTQSAKLHCNSQPRNQRVSRSAFA